MEHQLIDILRTEILGEPGEPGELSPSSDLFEAGLDSMAIMQLLLSIEDHFGVVLDPADLSRANFQTAASIAALIRSRQ